MSSIAMKGHLRNVILDCQEKKGYKAAFLMLDNLRKSALKKKPSDAVNNILGEVTEIHLELMLRSLCQEYASKMFYIKGLCIKNPHTQATTELDLTLVTPSKIILLESKYRKGACELIDECTVKTSYSNFDVHSQNLHHLKQLALVAHQYRLNISNQQVYKLALFLDSPNEIADLRSRDWRVKEPLLTTMNLKKELVEIAFGEINWDVQQMSKVFRWLNSESSANFKEHMKGVKTHGSRKD